MSILDQEIREQPAVLAVLLDAEMATARTVAEAMRAFNPAFVSIAARGTSDNAARYAQYVLGIHARLPVALATPSIHTLYQTAPRLDRALVIGISQSGQAADVCKVIEDARAQGALTLSITNFPDSPLAQAADYHLALHAGEERSVAATKTYTAQLMAIAMIAAHLVDSDEMLDGLRHVPADVEATLKLSAEIAAWAERYRYIEAIAAIGRGYNYCTAFEVNLKVQELCYVTGNSYSEADFLHGPIAMVQRGFPVLVVAPSGKTVGPMREFLSRLRDRDAESLVISNEGELLAAGTKQMRLPEGLAEWLSPIAAVIPGQIFAMLLAGAKGNPIDKPIGLSKVTVTL